MIDEREKRGDNGECGEKTDKSRCDGRDGIVERPEEDEHSGEEECQSELKKNRDGAYDVLDAPCSEVVQAILAHPRNRTGCP